MKAYPPCNVLGEGPNVSHTRRAIKPAIWGAIVAALSLGLLYAWRYQP